VDSAIVAIHENNKTRDQVTGPRHQGATDRVSVTVSTNEQEAETTTVDSVKMTIDSRNQINRKRSGYWSTDARATTTTDSVR
jgi:hypothetical protein